MNFFYQSLAVSLKPEEGEGIWGLALDAENSMSTVVRKFIFRYLSKLGCPVRIASITNFPVIFSFPSLPFLWDMMMS